MNYTFIFDTNYDIRTNIKKYICSVCRLYYKNKHCCECKLGYNKNHCCECKSEYRTNHCCECKIAYNKNHCCECKIEYNKNHCCECKLSYKSIHCCLHGSICRKLIYDKYNGIYYKKIDYCPCYKIYRWYKHRKWIKTLWKIAEYYMAKKYSPENILKLVNLDN